MKGFVWKSFLTGLAALAFALPALAEDHDIPNWADWEAQDGFLNARCNEFNQAFKINVSCVFDHASFEKLQHVPAFRQGLDSLPGPNDMCGTVILSKIYDAEASLVKVCSADPSCSAKLAKAVKKVVCRASATTDIALDKGTLLITVNADSGHKGDGWVQSKIDKLFPFKSK